MPRKKSAPPAKPPKPAQRSSAAAQALAAGLLQGLGEKYQDANMVQQGKALADSLRDAGERLAKAAKQA